MTNRIWSGILGENETIKPCPFCNELPYLSQKSKILKRSVPPNRKQYIFNIYCKKCGRNCKGRDFVATASLQKAISRWNKRAENITNAAEETKMLNDVIEKALKEGEI